MIVGGGFPQMFSPHTRGCSLIHRHMPAPNGVFPAYAGMFLSAVGISSNSASFPRIRGDVPVALTPDYEFLPFSPHTRGCSQISRQRVVSVHVFPAYAGMFPPQLLPRAMGLCFPRIRGDVPGGYRGCYTIETFSPHTRGCSPITQAKIDAVVVFPAYAGMFLVEGAAGG